MNFGFRSTIKSLFNVKSWLGWDSLVQNGVWIRSIYGKLVEQPVVSDRKETFNEACERYGYTPEFLAQQIVQFEKAAILYFSLLCLGVLYMAWLFFHHRWLAFFVMIPLNFMLFSFYFRESFWLMQIRQKRLGMGFRDWLNIVVLRNEQTG